MLQVFNATRPPLSYWVRGLTLDQYNNVYLVDAELNRVVKWAPNGTQLYSYTAQLRYPSDVAVDAAGNVFVVDEDKNRVVQFLNNGSQVATFTTSNPTLSYPTGIVVDPKSGYLYVGDRENYRVVVISPITGALLAVISPPGIPMCPEHMAMDTAGNLYVCDLCADRLIVFQLSTSPPQWIAPLPAPHRRAVECRVDHWRGSSSAACWVARC